VYEKLPENCTMYFDQETWGMAVKAARTKPDLMGKVEPQPGGLHCVFAAELGLFNTQSSFILEALAVSCLFVLCVWLFCVCVGVGVCVGVRVCCVCYVCVRERECV